MIVIIVAGIIACITFVVIGRCMLWYMFQECIETCRLILINVSVPSLLPHRCLLSRGPLGHWCFWLSCTHLWHFITVHGCKVVVNIWKPFHFHVFRVNWHSKHLLLTRLREYLCWSSQRYHWGHFWLPTYILLFGWITYTPMYTLTGYCFSNYANISTTFVSLLCIVAILDTEEVPNESDAMFNTGSVWNWSDRLKLYTTVVANIHSVLLFLSILTLCHKSAAPGSQTVSQE